MDTTQLPGKVLAPKASGCFLGGTQEIFGAVSEDLLGGAAKAEDAKLQGAGIIPKPCPMERVGTETMHGNKFHRCQRGPEPQEKRETGHADFPAADQGCAKKNGSMT
jgi:hypothetical protein